MATQVTVRCQESFKPRLGFGLIALYVTIMALVSLGYLSRRDFAKVYLTLGDIAFAKGAYVAAEAAFEKALEIQETHFENDAIATRQQLVVLYEKGDKFSRIDALLNRAMELERKAHGAIHEHVVHARDNLAQFYMKIGAYDDAERLFKDNVEIAKLHLPQLERDCSNNLGEFYLQRAQFEKAQPFLDRAVTLSGNPQSFEEKRNLYYALTQLGRLYLECKKPGTSELVLLRALNLLVFDDPERRAALRLLGRLYLENDDMKNAESVLLEALRLSQFNSGPDRLNDDVPDDLKRLSALYYRKDDYEKARELLDRSLEIKLLIHGPYHTDVKKLMGRLAVIAAERKDYSSSLEYFDKTFAIDNQHIADIFTFTSEAQKLDFIHTLSGSQNQFLSIFYQHLRHERQYYNKVFEHVLQRKGVVLDVQSLQEESLRRRLTGKALELWEERFRLRRQQAHLLLQGGVTLDPATAQELETVRRRLQEIEENLAREGGVPYIRYNQQSLNRAYELVESLSHPPTGETRELDRLRRQQTRLLLQEGVTMDPATAQELERVRQRLQEIEERLKSDEKEKRAREAASSAISQRPSVTVVNIQNHLPEGSALIEFVKFRNFDWTGRNSGLAPINEQYLAWVFTKKGDVHLIDLGDAREMDILVWRVVGDMHLITKLHSEGEILGPDHSVIMRSRANLIELSSKLWNKELRDSLRGVDKLLLSPDG